MAEKLPEKFAKWHGIDRTKIPWYPTIDENKCIGCKLCFVTCGREVFDFDMERNKAIVARKFQCMVGCSTCAAICPAGAITFPDKEIVHKIEREEKILVKIQQKALEKKVKMDLEKVREEVMDALSRTRASISYELAGHILESELMKKLHDVIKDNPVDIVDIKIETTSMKGCWEQKAPSYCTFKLVSTEMEDISEFEKKIDEVIKKARVVLVGKK